MELEVFPEMQNDMTYSKFVISRTLSFSHKVNDWKLIRHNLLTSNALTKVWRDPTVFL